MGYRVLHITPWFPNRPGEQQGNFIFDSVTALHNAGNDVATLVARPWTPRIFGLLHPDWNRAPLQQEQFFAGLNILVKHYPSIPRCYLATSAAPLFRLGVERAVRLQIERQGTQIIHAHTEAVAEAILPIAQKLNLPLVVTLHGINTTSRLLDTAKKKTNLRRTLSRANRVILVGETLRSYFATLAGGDGNFRFVPNGFIRSEPVVEKNLFRSGILGIISVSNLHEGKGIDLNLLALAGLNLRGQRNWHYTIVGGGRERNNLETMARNLGLAEQVEFLGPLPHDQVFAALNAADVFLLSSYREAFGVAYLEAMAAGIVTIGVQGQGPEAFISHGETGYLVPPRDIQAITDLLYTITEDTEKAIRIAIAGRNHVRQHFTWDCHAEKLTALYTEVLEGRP